MDYRYKRDVNSHLLLYTKQNRRLYEIVCSVSKSAEGEGLASSQPCGLLRLTPFPSARRRGPCKLHSQGVDKSTIFVSHAYVYKRAYAIGIKNKRCRLLDTFLPRGYAEREGFEPPEPRSSTVFKTAAIDHSATSPKDKSSTSF